MDTAANRRYHYKTMQHTTPLPTNIKYQSVSLSYELFVFSLSQSALKLGSHLMNQAISFTFSWVDMFESKIF